MSINATIKQIDEEGELMPKSDVVCKETTKQQKLGKLESLLRLISNKLELSNLVNYK